MAPQACLAVARASLGWAPQEAAQWGSAWEVRRADPWRDRPVGRPGAICQATRRTAAPFTLPKHSPPSSPLAATVELSELLSLSEMCNPSHTRTSGSNVRRITPQHRAQRYLDSPIPGPGASQTSFDAQQRCEAPAHTAHQSPLSVPRGARVAPPVPKAAFSGLTFVEAPIRSLHSCVLPTRCRVLGWHRGTPRT